MDWAFTFLKRIPAAGVLGLVRTPPEKRDMNAVEKAARKCAELLAIPDAALAERPYLGGNDLHHRRHSARLPCAALDAAADRAAGASQPKAWFDRLCERPAFTKIVDIPLS